MRMTFLSSQLKLKLHIGIITILILCAHDTRISFKGLYPYKR